MNSKNIKKHLNAKLNDWLANIEDDNIKKILKENVIITGGALVSLLTDEKVHDYDVYLRTNEACKTVAEYYVQQWNKAHGEEGQIYLKVIPSETIQVPTYENGERKLDENGKPATHPVVTPERIKVFVPSAGVVEEEKPVDTEVDAPFPPIEEVEQTDEDKAAEEASEEKDKPKYRPVFMSSNAITLSDKIQIVTRFYGEVEVIHKNYDFAHCTCSWTSWNNKVQLPEKALECIINKELYYIGSKYPLCSIIRTRKYLERGYHINAGQYVKMAFQLNELNLYDLETLEDQLTGVDSGYFAMMIEALWKKANESGEAVVDKSYVFELINRMF